MTAGVAPPRYPRRAARRIAHLGIGRFHRAHQAAFLHRLLEAGHGEDWGYCAIALRPEDRATLESLRSQDHLYSLWELDGARQSARVIGSIMESVDAIADRAPALATLADAATRIVSLTITEAGYCLDATGALDRAHPDIVHDLAHPAQPRSVPALLVRALAVRRAAGSGSLTLMSCDNLVENGQRLRRAVLDFAALADAPLSRWIETEISFPLSMVDRITPAADAQREAGLRAQLDFDDAAPVFCEPWLQWVLEDDFRAGRPAFERAGVTFTREVKRYEDAKLGLLNGGHSALSHAALLLGHQKVHLALADPLVARWLDGYLREVETTLAPPAGLDLAAYRRSLIARFANPAIEDRLLRLAQDSSQKFQQVLRPPLLHRLARGESVEHFAAAIALWLFWLRRIDTDATARAAYLDSRKDAVLDWARAGDAAAFVTGTLALPAADHAAFAPRVTAQLEVLQRAGVAGLLSTLNGDAS